MHLVCKMSDVASSECNHAKLYMKEHPIECLFFSEFHHEYGPRITFQVRHALRSKLDEVFSCSFDELWLDIFVTVIYLIGIIKV